MAHFIVCTYILASRFDDLQGFSRKLFFLFLILERTIKVIQNFALKLLSAQRNLCSVIIYFWMYTISDIFVQWTENYVTKIDLFNRNASFPLYCCLHFIRVATEILFRESYLTIAAKLLLAVCWYFYQATKISRTRAFQISLLQ